MIKASGLWKNTSKDGKVSISGNLGGIRVVIFPNTFKKEGTNEPDYNMYFEENKKKEEDGQSKPAVKLDEPF